MEVLSGIVFEPINVSQMVNVIDRRAIHQDRRLEDLLFIIDLHLAFKNVLDCRRPRLFITLNEIQSRLADPSIGHSSLRRTKAFIFRMLVSDVNLLVVRCPRHENDILEDRRKILSHVFSLHLDYIIFLECVKYYFIYLAIVSSMTFCSSDVILKELNPFPMKFSSCFSSAITNIIYMLAFIFKCSFSDTIENFLCFNTLNFFHYIRITIMFSRF